MAVPALRYQGPLTLTVEDTSGAVLAAAQVEDSAGHSLGRTGSDGRVSFTCAIPCKLHVAAPGFAAKTLALSADTIIHLELAGAAEQVTITAYRSPLGELQSPVITRLLDQTELQTAASVTMDGQLRMLPGVELFRRSSSLVANPSSQGMSLRGLGSTSANTL